MTFDTGTFLANADPFEGGCACEAVRYRMTTRPVIVHCCHCRWCQRESGASFALDAMAVEEYYDRAQCWPRESLARREDRLARAKEWGTPE